MDEQETCRFDSGKVNCRNLISPNVVLFIITGNYLRITLFVGCLSEACNEFLICYLPLRGLV